MSINLEFPPNQANEDDGLGNAGIATYREDPYAGAARETGQNSNDAPMGRPVRITFDLLEVPFDQIPDVVSLGEAVIACLAKARAAGDEKEIAFFEQAARVLQKGPLKVLRISDSNTTGLIGPPEIPGNSFHSLVKGSGVSKKLDPASGGSFGIGKNAVYAISDLQTVFYSTLYDQAGGQHFLPKGSRFLSRIKVATGCRVGQPGTGACRDSGQSVTCPKCLHGCGVMTKARLFTHLASARPKTGSIVSRPRSLRTSFTPFIQVKWSSPSTTRGSCCLERMSGPCSRIRQLLPRLTGAIKSNLTIFQKISFVALPPAMRRSTKPRSAV